MAAPTAPTLASIVSEALKKAGHSSPSSTLTTRAQDEWMEEIKNDIYERSKNLNSLQTDTIQITTNGDGEYAWPSDMAEVESMSVLHGSHYGTATAGGSSSITLPSTETYGSTDIIGKEIVIYSGTGSGQARQCTAYSSYVATVADAWDTNPDNTSKYLIVDSYAPVVGRSVFERDMLSNPTAQGRPEYYYPIGSDTTGKYILYPVPYSNIVVYVLRIRYYADIGKIDLSGTLMSTLYLRWRNVFVQGVFAKALRDIDDERYRNEMDIYRARLDHMVRVEKRKSMGNTTPAFKTVGGLPRA